jgi:penicillin-binding protein 1A
VVGLARAALYDVSHLCACQGGSTITQQLVKDLYLNGSDRGFSKLADMALALKVELQFSKAVILADYLSEVPTGYGLHGVAQAACAYFGRPLAALDLGEVALLAGMPQAPSAYDPRFHPHAAAVRRAEVLDAMLSEGYITAAQATAAGREPVTSAAGTACTAAG